MTKAQRPLETTTYAIQQKRGNKPSRTVGTFVCDSTFKSYIKEAFYTALRNNGIPIEATSKYCFKRCDMYA
jgi:ribosomal protein L34E